MADDAKRKNGQFSRLFMNVPEEYRARFEARRLETNVARMHGFAIYIVVIQVILQVINALYPQKSGDGMPIPLDYYIALSLASLLVGLVYWILFAQVRRGRIKSHGAKVFLVQSVLYLYALIQLTFCTLNILSHQGVNSYIILILMVGMVPVLSGGQGVMTVGAAFAYVLATLYFTQNITNSAGISAWQDFVDSDMRANLIIITGVTAFVSVFINNLYVSNFLKSVELEDANTNLEQTVRERTKELEEKTVAAQAASQAKSRFLTSMSHEIRTPLNAIIGMAHIAKKARTKEKSDASTDEILAASGHLLGILNDILDMSNIESGKLTIEKDRLVLNRVMEEVVSIIGEGCRTKGLVFSHNIDALPRVTAMGDKLRLRQVLINLLGNAVKFTPEDGQVYFLVNVTKETDAYADVRFVVKDTGIGIGEEQRERLFVAFEQGSAGNMKHGGAGLGLAISQNLVGMMGGEITVESAPGKGSVFAFEIRLEKTADAGGEGGIVIPDLTGKHILSAEDIEINRVVLTELLAETNAQVDEAADGAEAVEKFRRSPEGYYDFVFMDLLMPNMDGYGAARGIRGLNREDAVKVPIVALSANAYPEDIDRAIEAGMNSHLAKPVDFGAMMRILTEKIRI
ncbi:MAG: response regulator [Peptococcaceae bacterium]|nr:response regulator [Peptococcaceae bacterium]